ncbi:MAG TPA: hypothetical protein VFT64_05205 [Rickettsiales bacterium]|nr:hypothetical protein [Rickettsiales bacterium]
MASSIRRGCMLLVGALLALFLSGCAAGDITSTTTSAAPRSTSTKHVDGPQLSVPKSVKSFGPDTKDREGVTVRVLAAHDSDQTVNVTLGAYNARLQTASPSIFTRLKGEVQHEVSVTIKNGTITAVH